MSFDSTASIGKYRKVKDVAREWGVTPQHVRNLIISGSLPAYRVGNIFLIKEDAVESYLSRAAVGSKAA